MAQPVETPFLWRPQLRDPNDEMVLEAAVTGRADLLVTFNPREHGVQRRGGGSKRHIAPKTPFPNS